MTEDQIQIALVANIRARAINGLVWAHINNNPRSPRDGARLKAKGMIKGVPDMVYAYRGLTFWHEIKTEKGKLSPAQKEFHKRLEEAQHQVIITYGLDDAINQLVEIGLIRGV